MKTSTVVLPCSCPLPFFGDHSALAGYVGVFPIPIRLYPVLDGVTPVWNISLVLLRLEERLRPGWVSIIVIGSYNIPDFLITHLSGVTNTRPGLLQIS